MPTLTCPDCATIHELERVERSAACFCTECDNPLFWLPEVQLSGTATESGEEALRRLPGAGGRQQLVDLVCQACGERNPLGSQVCLRCSASLLPEPSPPAPEPAPEPPPPARVPVFAAPPPPERSMLWWWIALGIGLALVTIIVLLVTMN